MLKTMKVKDTHLIYLIKEEHRFNFGSFYFFDDFIISEINEGELFEWDKAQKVLEVGEKFYKNKGSQVNYISNRVHDYSIKPQDWLAYLNKRDLFKVFAVVTYRKTAIYNLVIERFFYKGEIFSFESLLEAVNFIRKGDKLDPVTDFEKLTQKHHDNTL